MTRVAAMVETSEHGDLLAIDRVEERVGESTENGLPHLPMHLGIGCREPKDTSRQSIDSSRQFRTEPGHPTFGPLSRLKDVTSGLGTKPEFHLRSTPEKFLAEDLPRDCS